MNLSDKQYQRIRIGLIMLGFGLVLFQYFVNRTMWTDESKLAINVMNLSFWELAHGLEFHQSAPILFLWMSKFFSVVFGNSDYALRLTPLLFGLASIPIFSQVIWTVTKSKFWSLFGLTFFILNLSFIYYSSEFKQYVVDLFVFVTMLYAVISSDFFVSKWRYTLLGLIGVVFLFLSNSTIMFMMVLGAILIQRNVSRKGLFFDKIKPLLVMFFAWFLGIVLFYILVVHNNPLKEFMVEFWMFSFPPTPFYSLDFLDWLGTFSLFQIVKVINIPSALFFSLLILSTIGNIIKRTWEVLWLFFALLAAHISLSYLHLYPMFERFLTYVIPLLIIYFTIGLKNLTETLVRWPKIRLGTIYTLSLFSISVLVFGVFNSIPFKKEELLPALEVIETYQESTDLTYVYYGSAVTFRRYQGLVGINNYVFGTGHRDNNEGYYTEIDSLLENNTRVWFVFSHIYPWKGYPREDEAIFLHLQKKGKITNDFKFKGSRVYFFQKEQSKPN